jgi:hypothetical protein
MSEETILAEIAYEAYRQKSGGKSLASGCPIPDFADLRTDIKEAWTFAACAVAEAVTGCIKGA